MIPGAQTVQMLMEGNPYYWGGFLIFCCLIGLVVWSEIKSGDDGAAKK